MAASDPAETLTSDEAQRLADFARACKAATRIVALYPATHPAIQASLRRVAEAGERLRGAGVAQLTILPDAMLLEGRAPAKPDGSLAELATLLHAHLIGELRVTAELSNTGWHSFLTLLAKPVEDLRAEGGIERVWTAGGGTAIEVRQIDYRQVLRERSGEFEGHWDHILTNYLQGEFAELDDATMAAIVDIADDLGRFKQFTELLVSKASEGGFSGSKDNVLRFLQSLADFVARQQPEQLNHMLTQITGVLPRLTPDLVVTLLTTGVPMHDGRLGIDLAGEVQSRLSDGVVAEFVAQSVSRDEGATARLAQAFQALVPNEDKRAAVLELAEREAENLPIGRSRAFPELWKSAAQMMTTYSDSEYVSSEYGRELATARSHAVEIEHLTDDPPERIAGWLATLSTDAIRNHEHQVLLDLLVVEKRATAWEQVLESALKSVEQHTLTGNLALAQVVLDAVVRATADDQPFAREARGGLERLRQGPLMRHVVLYTRQAPDSDVPSIAQFCQTLGPTVIRPLAEALATEQGAAVKRLRDVLLSFGAAGRAYADGLRNSANPAVRRTAIDLLRAFGGADALPDLAALLDDADPAVQRDALRAIVQIGTPEAYATLQQALKSGKAGTREAMMQVLSSSRDERAAPLFIHILTHLDHRGPLEGVYLSALEALGKLGGDHESVAALTTVLHRGEWWAPRRTVRLRTAAALALRSTGSTEAQRALEDAAANGARSVRRVARAALSGAAPMRRSS